jgi:hypothetical protein
MIRKKGKRRFKKIGLNIDAILRNASKQARAMGLVQYGAEYFEGTTTPSTPKRLFKKEAAYISR